MLRQPEPNAAASGCRRNKQIGFNIAAVKQGTLREAQKPSQPPAAPLRQSTAESLRLITHIM
jgi:hypothetical protein